MINKMGLPLFSAGLFTAPFCLRLARLMLHKGGLRPLSSFPRSKSKNTKESRRKPPQPLARLNRA